MARKEKKSAEVRRHHQFIASQNLTESQKQDMKAAAALVLTLDGSTTDDANPTEPYMMSPNDSRNPTERHRHYSRRASPVNENADTFIDLEAATSDRRPRNEARPSSESRDSNRPVRSGANAEPGPEGNEADDTENNGNAQNQAANSTSLNRTIAARLVNTKDLDRIVDQRIEQALEEERQRAAVAQIASENAELRQLEEPNNKSYLRDPNEWLIPFCVTICGPRGRLLAVISAVFGTAAIIVAIFYVVSRD